MPSTITPGLITLHGNQLEQLRDAVFDWIERTPLAPLEEEIFLVQSNGIAEWLKISLATHASVCASTQVTLPARFLWQVYRSVLGSANVSGQSPFDKGPLTWRLMALLPTLAQLPAYASLKHFLQNGQPDRCLQLAEKLADLYDQYQVYRAEWLREWAVGRQTLQDGRGQIVPLPADQLWQATLWHTLVEHVPEALRTGGRADVHQRFLDALRTESSSAWKLPRRVVLFGISALPRQTLEGLAALAPHTQVILAVPNPSRFYWGDIISGRELLTAERRRQHDRPGRSLSSVPLEQLHQHCHPLLAGWGRLGRDFIRMLDEFDDVTQTQAQFSTLRLDLFSADDGATMLTQMQAAIRDLQPLGEHDYSARAGDRSICFHIAHSAHREVEVLHDQLLGMLADDRTVDADDEARAALRPRDIIVMVPDIDTFAASVKAVFGQYGTADARHIPYAIIDGTERRANPLLVALDWLLDLPNQRCLQSEICDLLEVPALAARFGIDAESLPRIAQWIDAAGIRWGLDTAHRAAVDLGPAGAQNGWLFGIERMLLGYASGADRAYQEIEPFAQIGGLDAALAGCLASLVQRLMHWRTVLTQTATPIAWGAVARELCGAFFLISDERDRATMAKLEQCLSRWLDNCDAGGFAAVVPVTILREAWLATYDEAALSQRFVSGGVTFCTLLPMRAVPYRVVCLLGMNDGDFPRRTSRADFDLLALPQLARPGDRSRRDDDRYLMLEAVLSARDTLYVSWSGRSVRDNSEQPPSVLVAQLRDYLKQGWQTDLASRTSEHPLQPFSRRYFESGGPTTYAHEWRSAHDAGAPSVVAGAIAANAVPNNVTLSFADLERFLKQPVDQFFRQTLKVDFRASISTAEDDEPFSFDGLDSYQLDAFMLADQGALETRDDIPARLAQRAARLAREGKLPIGHLGAQWQTSRVDELAPVRAAWVTLSSRFVASAAKFPVLLRVGPVTIDDWLDGVRRSGSDHLWLARTVSRVTTKQNKAVLARPEKMIPWFVRQLTLSAAHHQIPGFLVGRDAILALPTIDPAEAMETLCSLLALWQQGMIRPLPTALNTAIALINTGAAAASTAYDGSAYTNNYSSADAAVPALARLWPDYAALAAASEHVQISHELYAPLLKWTARIQVHALDSTEVGTLTQTDAAA